MVHEPFEVVGGLSELDHFARAAHVHVASDVDRRVEVQNLIGVVHDAHGPRELTVRGSREPEVDGRGVAVDDRHAVAREEPGDGKLGIRLSFRMDEQRDPDVPVAGEHGGGERARAKPGKASDEDRVGAHGEPNASRSRTQAGAESATSSTASCCLFPSTARAGACPKASLPGTKKLATSAYTASPAGERFCASFSSMGSARSGSAPVVSATRPSRDFV
jgi:hypothetical protein